MIYIFVCTTSIDSCLKGVIEFSFCLFFAKLVSYTFLYWLPQYIKQVMIREYYFYNYYVTVTVWCSYSYILY